jgi:signal transduction histidine kinase
VEPWNPLCCDTMTPYALGPPMVQSARPGQTSDVPSRHAPTRLLIGGLTLALATIAGVGLYTFLQIRDLRDQQTAISDRNRKDSLQLLRIQNDLASLAVTMRDMAEGSEPYPPAAWQPAFERLRGDLTAAIALERTLAPAEREPAQQRRLEQTNDTYWADVDKMFAMARAGDNAGAVALIRSRLIAEQRALDGMVAQFLVANNRVQEEAARANRSIYDRVAAEILVLVSVLLVVVAISGAWIVVANRRAFEAVRDVTAQLRTLSRHTMRAQEDLQRSVSRELHDDFGQILTAIGTLLGRARRRAPDEAGFAEELDHVRGIAQTTLDRIRAQSQWLHPGVLDDFGLEKALGRAVEQFERQTGIRTTLVATGPIATIPPDSAIHVYRIVQEALSNIGRHSGSDSARVRIACDGDALDLSIEDAGHGLPSEGVRSVESGLGLVSMRERAELMGGHLRLRHRPEGGLVVEVRVPHVFGTAQTAVLT